MRRPVFRWLSPLLLLGLAASYLLAVGWAAESPVAHLSTDPVKHEITAVIDAQLAAFRANDFPKAYTFAAGEIREMFAADHFEAMVKAGYPLIARSSKATYGLAFDTGEEAVINVTIETTDGKQGEYQYLLKKEDGAWKIKGVAEIKPEGISV